MFETAYFFLLWKDNIVFKLKRSNLEICELMAIKTKVGKVLEKVYNNKNDRCKEVSKIKMYN